MCGNDIWLMADLMMKVMVGFHHRISRSIVGKKAQKVREEGWK